MFSNENQKTIRYFSMFTGVGGFELGLQNAGLLQQENKERMSNSDRASSQFYSCVGFSEIDKYANQLLTTKFPEVKNYGDATKINPRELSDFDMLCGGFPCQSFSIAGKRRGFQDTRGTMFFEIARILEIKRPKLIFLENVKGLLNHNKGETFKIILQTLEELGYEIQWMVLNSKFFGVPQNRERVFIIGSLRGTPRPEILPFKFCYSENNQMEQGEKIINYIQKADREIARIYNPKGISPALHLKTGGWQEPKIYENMLNTKTRDVEDALFVGKTIAFQEDKPVQSTYIPQNNDARCIQAGEPKEVLIEPSMKIRRLTPTECERLQGFPDGWTEGFSDTQRYKMMGNAVTINVIKAIGEKLPQIKNNEEKKVDSSLFLSYVK